MSEVLSEVATFRLTKSEKHAMKEIKINWGEEFRETIRRVRMEIGAKKMDKLRAKTKYGEYDLAKELEEWREKN